MKYAERFAPGTQHKMAKGILKVKSYREDQNQILMMTYTLNDAAKEYENKYVNVISIIYKWQKKNGLTEATTLQEFSELELVRPLKFGIEMELVGNHTRSYVEQKLVEAGIRVDSVSATHTLVSGWKLVHDGSIRVGRYTHGMELVGPPSTNFDELKIVCQVLKKCGMKTNNSTGIHVHHQIKELKRQQIMRVYEFYNKYELLIDKILPSNRAANRFCKPISLIIENVRSCEKKSDLLKKIAGSDSSLYYDTCRYYKINLRSFIFYGTIEFRQHNGSIDFEEISNWILFTHKIIDRAIQIGDDIKPFEEAGPTYQGMFREMAKELKIENTKLENNLETRFKKNVEISRRNRDTLWMAC